MPSTPSESIRYSQFFYEEEEVSVVFTKAFPSVMIGGVPVGPFEEGRDARVPFWVARILEAEGFVKIVDGDAQPLKPSDLYKLCWKEERNEGLSKLPKHFYPRLRLLLASLNEAIKDNPTHTVLSEHQQSNMKAKDLVTCRLQKILQLAMERNPSKTSIDLLEPEELALYNTIRTGIEEWRKRITSPE
ncbi:MAG: DNA replication complex GINS family protein [Candidatus Verstraetearchaeota archaeon]|nr:DNA replication complex GINS family protein [Candidatus Verstraetearchaeota archaeon]